MIEPDVWNEVDRALWQRGFGRPEMPEPPSPANREQQLYGALNPDNLRSVLIRLGSSASWSAAVVHRT